MAIDFWDVPVGGGPSGGIGPTYMENVWDILFVNGTPIPGICEVKAQPTIKFDEKKPGGSDGLRITGQGYLPGPVEIDVTIWTQDQWETFLAIVSLLWTKPKRGGIVRAIDVSHPALDVYDIKAIVVKGISPPEKSSVVGAKIIKIKAVEFLPPDPKPKTKTPKSSGNVPGDPRVVPAKNGGGKSPGESDTAPTGAKRDNTGGAK